jgi:hypothetical protein
MAYRDDDEDEADDWDDEAEDSDADSDDEPTMPCPYCRREMLEDSPRCPHCERYISAEDSPPSGRPVWVVVTALVCLAIAVWWVFATF